MAGGSTTQVVRADMPDGSSVVAKAGPGGHLPIERSMLDDLNRLTKLPVPRVRHAEADLLIVDYIPHDPGPPTAAAQAHLAALLAGLHAVPWPERKFGYPYDTAIGRLVQPNAWSESWIRFFRDNRLRAMAQAALDEGTLSPRLADRLETLADRLDDELDEPDHPALLHGDVWVGNVLARHDRVVGLIDPAIYVGHPEIELAYVGLLGGIGAPFYDRYGALRPIKPGFPRRAAIYNLYPLLVHVRYWDTGYADRIVETLDRLGV